MVKEDNRWKPWALFQKKSRMNRKRLSVSVALLLTASVFFANAQNVRLGVKGGLNFAKETQPSVMEQYFSTDLSYRTGFHVGGVADYRLSDRWGLGVEMVYSMQGYKDQIYTTAEQSVANENYTVTSHYINLPVAVKFYPANGFFVECGPQIGYLLSKKGKLQNWENINPYTFDNTERVDFGFFAGIGYSLSSGVFVEGRYIHGLNSTSKDDEGSRNRTIQLSVGYLF